MSTDMYAAISTLSTAIANTGGTLSLSNLTSSLAGLGGLGWASTSTVLSIVSTFNATAQVGLSTISSFASYNTSSLIGLGSIGYISSSTLMSSIQGLGLLGYISSSTLTSTVRSLGTLGYISSASLVSSIQGLGSGGYISSASFQSSLSGLGSLGYISSASLYSSISQYYSTALTVSTVQGLGSIGYISTSQLVSTTQGISVLKTNVSFNNTGQVAIVSLGQGTAVTFNNVNQVIYISSFLTSSIYYSGNSGTQIVPTLVNFSNMLFSTASIEFSPFSSFMNSNSFINLDIYPNLLFSKLATGATSPIVLGISSFLQFGSSNLYNTTTTSFFYAGNTTINYQTGTSGDASNSFNAPIRIAIPPNTVIDYSQPYNLKHFVPGSVSAGPFVNALNTNVVSPYFGSTGSVFVSVQNIM